jgi:hypothetical protein
MILFYESKRRGNGRGAVVAIARIVNSIILAKKQLETKTDKRLVVENVGKFSATEDVLLTTFDNLLTFPSIVSIKQLKKIGAVGGANLISAQSLPHDLVTKILTYAWPTNHVQ